MMYEPKKIGGITPSVTVPESFDINAWVNAFPFGGCFDAPLSRF
jgi:hypothetical protein